jgi:hypothetical protein
MLLERFVDLAEGKETHSQQSYQAKTALGMRSHQTGLLFYPQKSRNQVFRKL